MTSHHKSGQGSRDPNEFFGQAGAKDPACKAAEKPLKKMAQEDASALQSVEARGNEGRTKPGGLAAQAQSAAARNEQLTMRREFKEDHSEK
jgi:hypothetical protein